MVLWGEPMTYVLPIDIDGPTDKEGKRHAHKSLSESKRNWRAVNEQMHGIDFKRVESAPAPVVGYTNEVQLLAALENEAFCRKQRAIMEADAARTFDHRSEPHKVVSNQSVAYSVGGNGGAAAGGGGGGFTNTTVVVTGMSFKGGTRVRLRKEPTFDPAAPVVWWRKRSGTATNRTTESPDGRGLMQTIKWDKGPHTWELVSELEHIIEPIKPIEIPGKAELVTLDEMQKRAQDQIAKAVAIPKDKLVGAPVPNVYALPNGVYAAFKFNSHDGMAIYAETDDSLRSRVDAALAASNMDKTGNFRSMIKDYSGQRLDQYALTVHIMRTYYTEEYVQRANKGHCE